MIKRFQNDRGYSLFLTMLIIILFGVLSVLLLSVVVSGAQKNAIREQVTQAGELSEKGIEHITNQIHNELEDKIGEHGIGRDNYLKEVSNILNSYLCVDDNYISIESETGDYEVCIDEWKDFDGENSLRKEVTFKSTGIVEGKIKELKSTTVLGATDVPDALNYAIGSYKLCPGGKCSGGEGNLYLHGGVSIRGDIKVDGDLVTYDKGYIRVLNQNGHFLRDAWVDSVKPNAKPGPNTEVSKLVLGGNVYKVESKPSLYSTHLEKNNFNRSGYKLTTLEDAFGVAPIQVSRELKREKVEITEQAKNFKYGFNDPNVKKIKGTVIENENHSNKKVFPYYETVRRYICEGSIFFPKYCNEYEQHTDGTYTFTGHNTFGQFATNGTVLIRGNKNRFDTTTTIEHGMYVHKDLKIGNTNIGLAVNNPNQYEKIRLNGNIYVNGDLEIIGADAEFNAIIYVNGKVTIRNSRINGIKQNGKEGTLIVFAKKPISIANISVYQNEEKNLSKIRGFFYSEDAFEMFGVGSNIRVEGGISAKRISLNAIRGRADSSNFSNSNQVEGDYYEKPQGQHSRPSRLQIIYNPEIINTYSDLKQQEPIITKLDPPELISRD